MKYFATRLTSLLIGSTLVVAPGYAHHSFGMFDKRPEAEIVVEGVVKEWQLVNPHSWLYITVTNEDGSQTEWSFEAGTTAQLIQRGITLQTYGVGDVVRVRAGPSRDDAHVGMVKVVQHEDRTYTVPIQTGDGQAALDRWLASGD